MPRRVVYQLYTAIESKLAEIRIQSISSTFAPLRQKAGYKIQGDRRSRKGLNRVLRDRRGVSGTELQQAQSN